MLLIVGGWEVRVTDEEYGNTTQRVFKYTDRSADDDARLDARYNTWNDRGARVW
jgi:hypothetical protein